ncbi:MAG: hypothetical protein L0L93_12385 [Brevibacterium sp.]|nr:hypothetical protein [Brevibacterium sp.]MDN6747775.1 hypothetical protein [Brevibacterium sp.]
MTMAQLFDEEQYLSVFEFFFEVSGFIRIKPEASENDVEFMVSFVIALDDEISDIGRCGAGIADDAVGAIVVMGEHMETVFRNAFR